MIKPSAKKAKAKVCEYLFLDLPNIMDLISSSLTSLAPERLAVAAPSQSSTGLFQHDMLQSYHPVHKRIDIK